MSDACVIASGAISGMGLAGQAYGVGAVGQTARVVIARDDQLANAGLHRPFCARAVVTPDASSFVDRATALLSTALGQVVASLDQVRPGWRGERVGLSVGTSSGGMLSAERFFQARDVVARGETIGEEERVDLARRATYFAPFDEALSAYGLSGSSVCRRTHLVAACAASTLAMGLALRWLDRNACDVVIAGGYDAVSVFVAMGFEALRATTASTSKPFRVGRDGMSLGEGAGLVALVRSADVRDARVLFRIAGFGASTDAVHITAPDRTGKGLSRAGLAAMQDSGLSASEIGLVSAHATATPFNDAMESRAIATMFDTAVPPVVHPFKAQIGHTLGAAGVLETLAAADAITRGVAPAAAGQGDLDPDASVTLLERSQPMQSRAALKLSAAFGGANAALVITKDPSLRKARVVRSVYVRATARIGPEDLSSLSEATGVARDRLARLDTVCKLGLRAVAAVAHIVGTETIRGAGIVAGHALATIDTNDRFDSKRRSKGPTLVDPRLFPATSPNAIAGECAIVFGLTGPSFAVNAGFDGGSEALSCAAELVAAADADQMIVVVADDAGPAARDLLTWSAQGHRKLQQGAFAVVLAASSDGALGPIDLDVAPFHDADTIGHLAMEERLKTLGLT